MWIEVKGSIKQRVEYIKYDENYKKQIKTQVCCEEHLDMEK